MLIVRPCNVLTVDFYINAVKRTNDYYAIKVNSNVCPKSVRLNFMLYCYLKFENITSAPSGKYLLILIFIN